MEKRYDRAYFQRWYRGEQAVNPPATVRRKVALAVAVGEYFLKRPLRSVLDVGCGEGAWFAHLRVIRPRVSYCGVDRSAYVVKRFGRQRNIRRGSFGELASLKLRPAFDLVVCSDVLHYLSDDDIARGIDEIARLCGGIAYVEAFTTDEDVIGDLEGLIQRPPSWYRTTLRRAGFMAVGPYCWLAPAGDLEASGLELAR